MMSIKMTMMNCDKHNDEHIDEIVYNGIAECGNVEMSGRYNLNENSNNST